MRVCLLNGMTCSMDSQYFRGSATDSLLADSASTQMVTKRQKASRSLGAVKSKSLTNSLRILCYLQREKVKAVISSKNRHNEKEDVSKKATKQVWSYSHAQLSHKNICASFTHYLPAMEKHFFRVWKMLFDLSKLHLTACRFLIDGVTQGTISVWGILSGEAVKDY